MTDLKAIAAQIANQLGETETTPRVHIQRILSTIGPKRTQAFVEQALVIEATGGMLLPDGSRKRTLGGVFFRLVRDQVSEADPERAQAPCKGPRGPRSTSVLPVRMGRVG